MKQIRIVTIEDELLIRESLKQLFTEIEHQELVFAADSAESFFSRRPDNLKPDIILLDIQMPGLSGIQSIPRIKKLYPDVDIIMLTTYENSESIFTALENGAVAYMSKEESLINISKTIDTVYAGGSYMSPQIARKVLARFEKPRTKIMETLTPRQKEITEAIVDGLSYKMVADKLHISLNTVRDHIKTIYKVVHVNSKAELISKVMKDD